MSLVTIIGRGHSGTRMISHTLYASGVFMGRTINTSGDKVPPGDLYDACRVMAKYVKWNGDLSWNFDELHTMPIDPEFTQLIESYLADVLNNKATYKGWKLPETTLIFPWIARMFPDMKYIYLVRDPRDSIIGRHKTDDLRDFGIDYPDTNSEREQRAISWKYQYEMVKATPQPKNWLPIRFEDFILDQENTVQKLEDFLEIPLCRIIVRKDPVGRWKTDTDQHYFDLFRESMVESSYTEGLPE
ncbi:MAG: sulfotransferase [Candidatus Latescibacteria bacterium]|nr:sulfotransferase [Candidatus Latescibacterota bacterium]